METPSIFIEGREYRLLDDAAIVDGVHDRYANGDRIMPERRDIRSDNSRHTPFHKVYRPANLPAYVPVE